jgi:hypothetical protein
MEPVTFHARLEGRGRPQLGGTDRNDVDVAVENE